MSRTTSWIALAAAAALSAAALGLPPTAQAAAPATIPAGNPTAAPAPTLSGQEEFTGRVIVKFASGPGGAPLAGARPVAQVGDDVDVDLSVRAVGSDASLVEGATPQEAPAVAAALDERAEVEYATPERVYHPFAPSEYTNGPSLGAAGSGVAATSVWGQTRGSGVTVAVLDTGIVLGHEAFTGRLMQGADTASAQDHDATPGRDTDPTEPDLTGRNCSNGTAARQSWHGTHVAGSVAAVAPQAGIIPVRVGGGCGIAGLDMVDGIKWAIGQEVSGLPVNANRADVINLSLGSKGSCSPYEQAAIDAAIAAGATVITAAGNDSSSGTYTPASCRGVVNVAAIDSTGKRALFSNYGATVNVSAPGVNIVSAVGPTTTSWGPMQGTSMAAPHVAGVAALIKSYKNTLTPVQIRNSLITSALPTGGVCSGCGAGRVNAPAALVAADNGGSGLIVTAVTPVAGKVGGGDTITLTGQGFAQATHVMVGSARVKIATKSDTSITFKAPKSPAGKSGALVDVSVVTPDATTTAATQYRYAAIPVIRSVAPKALTPDGGLLTITGTGFATDATVTVDGTPVTVGNASATSLTIQAPAKETTTKATGLIVVTANDLPSKAAKFTYAVPKIRLQSTSKKIPAEGADLLFTGNDLDKVTSLTLNNTALPTSHWEYEAERNALIVVAPPLAFKARPAAKFVAINKWNGKSNTLGLSYEVPKVTLKAPKAALTPDGGAAVFTGTNLLELTEVRIGETVIAEGGTSGWASNAAGTALTVPIPTQTAGTKSVAVTVRSDYIELRPVAVKIAVPKPRIATAAKTVPAAGGTVELTGTNLSTVSSVSLNGTPLATSAWTRATDNAKITVTLPARPSSARVPAQTLLVTNKWDVKSNAVKVSYLAG